MNSIKVHLLTKKTCYCDLNALVNNTRPFIYKRQNTRNSTEYHKTASEFCHKESKLYK